MHLQATTTHYARVKVVQMAFDGRNRESSRESRLGLAAIKPKQREAISELVTGNDIFISLPTGRKCCRVSQQLFGSLQNFTARCSYTHASLVVYSEIWLSYN